MCSRNNDENMENLKKFEDLINYHNTLKDNIYEYFLLFQRFEAKVGKKYYVRNSRIPKVDWNKFCMVFESVFNDITLSDSQDYFINTKNIQTFSYDNNDWINFSYKSGDDKFSDLKKLVYSLKNVRNNLFHGSKGDELETAIREENTHITLEKAIQSLKELILSFNECRNSDLEDIYHDFFRY